MTVKPEPPIDKKDILTAVKTLMIGSSGPDVIETISKYLIIDKGLYRAARSVKTSVKLLVASTLSEINATVTA